MTKRTTTNISNMPAQSLGRDHYSLVKKGRENAPLWRERQSQRKQIRNMSLKLKRCLVLS